MKRSAPLPSRPRGFLTQKKIRIYLQPKGGDKSVVPLSITAATDHPYEQAKGSPLTAELRHAMLLAVKDQLQAFKDTEPEPLSCAFHKEHTRGEYVASHYIRFFDELCRAFLTMFDSLRLPVAYDVKQGGCFLEKDNTFKKAWTTFHKKRANLRILCRACHLLHTETQYKVKGAVSPSSPPPQQQKKLTSLNDALNPYIRNKTASHPWLDIKTWGEKTTKGNYSRKLGEKLFTLFQRDNKWRYAYNGDFSKASESHDTVEQLLSETYHLFGNTIHRYL
jgi:hypothetical protein